MKKRLGKIMNSLQKVCDLTGAGLRERLEEEQRKRDIEFIENIFKNLETKLRQRTATEEDLKKAYEFMSRAKKIKEFDKIYLRDLEKRLKGYRI